MYYHNGDGNTAVRLQINSGLHVLDMGTATGSRWINDLYHSRSEQ